MFWRLLLTEDSKAQLGSVSSERRFGVFILLSHNSKHTRDDENEHVRPTWTVGALLRGARCIHLSHVCFHIVNAQQHRCAL